MRREISVPRVASTIPTTSLNACRYSSWRRDHPPEFSLDRQCLTIRQKLIRVVPRQRPQAVVGQPRTVAIRLCQVRSAFETSSLFLPFENLEQI
jgi:hypothetical protein